MKKILSFFLAITMVLSLTACGTAENQESGSSEASESSSTAPEQETTDSSSSEMEASGSGASKTSEVQGSNVLVAYFSWADNAILAGDVDAVVSPSVIPPGNVQQLAGWVQEETGSDLFSIRVTDPYPSDWDDCLARANEERGDNARPELVENVENLDQYDTVFLGYPNWWGDMPMILYTFLDEYDFAGKTLAPFNTSGGSGFSGSLETIAQMEPDAKITDGLTLGSDEAENCADAVSEWLGSIGLAG